MPELFEVMSTMRAMRRLKPDPVPDELINKILQAGQWAPSGGNTQRWRFLVVKDPEIKKKVQVYYKRLFDETVGPRYAASAPPPGSDPARYKRQQAAVEYLTDHYHEAPVWIVACLEDGENPGRTAGSSIYGAVQNMCLATRALGLGTTLTTSSGSLARSAGRSVCCCTARNWPRRCWGWSSSTAMKALSSRDCARSASSRRCASATRPMSGPRRSARRGGPACPRRRSISCAPRATRRDCRRTSATS